MRRIFWRESIDLTMEWFGNKVAHLVPIHRVMYGLRECL